MIHTDPSAHGDEFPPPFRLGSWLVQADLNRVSGPDGDHRVEPRVMRVLLCLARRPGEVWTRQALLDAVWGDAIVGEEILTRAISELRRIFGDKAREPRFIETIRHHGYRLISTPEPVENEAPDSAPEPKAEDEPEPQPESPAEPVIEPPAEPGYPPDLVPEPPLPAPDPEPAPATPASVPPPPMTSPASVAAAPRGRPLIWAALALVVLVVGLMLGPRLLPGEQDAPTRDTTAAQAIPLTSFPGREWDPALSPDGRRVAFVWTGPEEGNPGLYVKQRNNETPLRLTPEGGWVAWPVFSPDGQTLAFVHGEGGEQGICLVPSLGGAVQTLQPVESWVEGMDFAPDGRTLVYAARLGAEGRYTLLQLDLETLEQSPCFPGSGRRAGDFQPRISPQGDRLAFIGVGPGGQNRLYVADWPGGKPRALGRQVGNLQGLDFTADGRHLIYAASPTGSLKLWWVALDGSGEAQPIPTAGAFAWNPRVAREGGQLVYEEVDTDQDIWRMRIVGQDPWRLETGAFLRSTRWEQEARFGPEGQSVVFLSSRSGSPQVWLADGQGQQPRRLTSLASEGLSTPRLSPDGGKVAFNALQDGRLVIMVASVRGGAARSLTPADASELLSGWSSDGQSLLFAVDGKAGWQVFRRQVESAETVPVLDAPAVTAVEASGGGILYFTRADRRGLWRLPLDERGQGLAGAEPEEVLPDLPSGHRNNWMITGNQLHWLMPAAGTTMLMRTDLETDQTRMVGELPAATGEGLAVSPDGKTILYPRTGPLEGDLMLLEGF